MPALWLILALLPTAATALPTTWDWGHPSPHGNQHNAIVWGNSEYVAVADGGNIVTSPDGTSGSWTKQPSPTTNALNAVAWNMLAGTDMRYVAVGDEGTVMNSADGQSWNITTTTITDKLTDVIWNGSFFLVVGEKSETVNHPVNGSVSRPVAVILKSKGTEGFSWTLETPTLDVSRYSNVPPPRINGITWNAGRSLFVATGDTGTVLTSTDGVAWNSRSFNSIVWNGSIYLAVGDNGLAFTSPDGTNWTFSDTGVTENLHGVSWGGSTFVAVGDNGTAIISATGASSSWSVESTNTTERLRDIATNGANFAAVGDNGTIVTRTGSTWSAQNSGITNEHLHAIARDTTNFVYAAVGTSGTILRGNNAGDSWSAGSVTPTGFATDLLSVSWGNNVFIATGKAGTVVTSSNAGVTWDECTDASCSSSEWLFDSIWDGVRHIAVGSNGTVIISTDDGATWSPPTPSMGSPPQPNTPETLLAVAAATGSDVIVGGENGLLTHTTTPTSDWNAINGRVVTDLNDIIYNISQYTIVGSNGLIMTSTNPVILGIASFIPPVASGIDLFDITAHPSTSNLYASGAWGVVISSADNGNNWTAPTTPPSRADFLYGVAARTSTNTATTVGSGGALFSTINSGVDWADAGPNLTTDEINSLATGSSMMVAVGNGGAVINSTTDGVSWDDPTASPFFCPGTGTTNHLNGVAWKPTATTRFVAVGDAGTVRISNDGCDWSTAPSTPPDSSHPLYAITWGNDLFVAVGGATNSSIIYTSPDGDVWTLRNPGTSKTLRDVTWSPAIEQFVAVGDNGTILTSKLGVNWVDRSGATTTDLDNVASSDSLILATGTSYSPSGGVVLQSSSGIGWSGGNTLAGLFINDLVFGGTQFVGVGPSGLIAVSTNGQNWERLSTGTNSLLKAALWDGGKFLAGGTNGHILYSTNPDLIITGAFEKEKVRSGEVARYSFTIRNGGPSTATNADYTGPLPSGSTLLSASSTKGNCGLDAAEAMVCQFGDLVSGEAATVTIDVTVSELGNQAITANANRKEEDADTGNDEIRISIQVDRGNSPTGGASLNYFTLMFLLIYLLFVGKTRRLRRL